MRNMKIMLTLLLGALLLIACKSQHVNDEPAKYDTLTDVNLVLEELQGRDVVLFVADQDEISPAEVPFPVVFTGMGKMRMFSALVKWHETLPEGSHPVVLNIGSAGSAKYPIGTIVNCTRIFNGGCELVHDCIDLPGAPFLPISVSGSRSCCGQGRPRIRLNKATIVNCPRIFNGLKVIFRCTRQKPWPAGLRCR